ncbi:DUF5123 domain-containing protein [Flavobacterium sp. DGU38]|uniref:DUF5123 domain-containing protein n=1 Tax=Flavobacterium calami TaxID=3139144 RepID=A0ABU9IR46_9FLAO
MKIKNILKGLMALLLLTFSTIGCEGYNEALLDDLGNTREFSPIGLTAVVRNQTFVELNWTTKENVDHYVVEFSEDDPNFTTIYKTVEVLASQLPVRVQLEGEVLYSIRVKAVTPGLEDSKWVVTQANTLSEQIFLPVVPGDIQAKQATLRWTPNSTVTHIFLNPGSISHLITAEEKATGVATITGLSAETPYTATLYNATKKRGVQEFTTGIDIGTGILVTPTDDLLKMIADAASGAVLVLEAGDYTSQTGLVKLTKSITLRGLRTYDKPKVKINFDLGSTVANFSLIDMDMTGGGLSGALITTTSNAQYNDLLISNCNIHDFASNPLFYASVAAAKIKSFTLENSIVKNVVTSADLIDFRASYGENIVLKNSTFDTCSARDFIREDNGAAATLSGTGLTTNVSIDKCTLYNLTATRIFYVRFASNELASTNTLFVGTNAVYGNQSATDVPSFTNNNYFTAPNLNAGVAANKPDTAGTTLDPQFVNAATGDFTIKNQALLDRKVGDPRWIK